MNDRDGSGLRLLVWGGNGRLGRAIQTEAANYDDIVVSQVVRELPFPSLDEVDVVIDVSAPSAFDAVTSYCLCTRTPLLECVSNLSEHHIASLKRISNDLPLLRSENLSFGHFLQERLIEYLARLLPDRTSRTSVTVVERHPLAKAHRPSATANRLAAVARTAGYFVGDVASIRGGTPVSDHSILISLTGASLTIEHKVVDLTAAAYGALAGARWLVGKPAGFYATDSVYNEIVAFDRHSATGHDDR